jgi:hypothetical protein
MELSPFFGRLVTALVAVAVYCLPMIVALVRHHRDSAPILLINLFFGWTVVGWVMCLAWSFSTTRESQLSL